LQDFAERINLRVGYEVIEAPGDEIIPCEELPVDNQKIVVFDDLVCESNQNNVINYFYQRAAQKLLCYLPYSNLLQGTEKYPG